MNNLVTPEQRKKMVAARIRLRWLANGHEETKVPENLAMHAAFRTLGIPNVFRPVNVHELREIRPNFCPPIVIRVF
jgi:hypothetical protein